LEDADDEPILCDNKQTVLILEQEQPNFKTQLKHINDVHNHWLRQEVQKPSSLGSHLSNADGPLPVTLSTS
jgi:hypothetical protein